MDRYCYPNLWRTSYRFLLKDHESRNNKIQNQAQDIREYCEHHSWFPEVARSSPVLFPDISSVVTFSVDIPIGGSGSLIGYGSFGASVRSHPNTQHHVINFCWVLHTHGAACGQERLVFNKS